MTKSGLIFPQSAELIPGNKKLVKCRFFISRLAHTIKVRPFRKMQGMNAKSGKMLEGIDHLEQSISDILSTPIGTRIMRRSYGSRLMYLLDQPMSAGLVAAIQAAVVEALINYEPRVKLSRVIVNGAANGQIDLTIEGFYVPDSRVIRLENITIR